MQNTLAKAIDLEKKQEAEKTQRLNAIESKMPAINSSSNIQYQVNYGNNGSSSGFGGSKKVNGIKFVHN